MVESFHGGFLFLLLVEYPSSLACTCLLFSCGFVGRMGMRYGMDVYNEGQE
jgi:hypothetical protein